MWCFGVHWRFCVKLLERRHNQVPVRNGSNLVVAEFEEPGEL